MARSVQTALRSAASKAVTMAAQKSVVATSDDRNPPRVLPATVGRDKSVQYENWTANPQVALPVSRT
jgi:hypothetical protein